MLTYIWFAAKIILALVLLLLLFVACKILKAVIRYQILKRKLPQDIPRLPGLVPMIKFFSNDPSNGGFRDDLQQFFDKDGNIKPIVSMGSYLEGTPLIAVTDAEDLKKLFVEEDFPKLKVSYEIFDKILGKGLVLSSGALWKRQRRLITPIFHFAQLKDMALAMSRQSERMVEELKETNGEFIPVTNFFSQVALRVIIDCAFGGTKTLNADKMQVLWKKLNHSFNNYAIFDLLLGKHLNRMLPWPWTSVVDNRVAILKKLVMSAINERKNSKEGINTEVKKDLLGELLKARDEDGNGIEVDIMVDECLTFLFAGHDTTSNLMSWTMNHLAENPHVQTKVKEEVDSVLGGRAPVHADIGNLVYTKQVLQESLRMTSPVPMTERQAAKDCVLAGKFIPKGTYIWPMMISAHFDPKHWVKPNEFRPERFDNNSEERKMRHPFSFVPFIAGSRNCIGQKFALTEATILLAQVMQHFTVEKSMEHSVAMVFEGTCAPMGLHCKFIPRS